jgi:predicted deacylase
VNDGQLGLGGMPSLQMLDVLKETGIVAQRTRDGAEAADMLGVAPPGVVPPAVAVGDECGPQGPTLASIVRGAVFCR